MRNVPQRKYYPATCPVRRMPSDEGEIPRPLVRPGPILEYAGPRPRANPRPPERSDEQVAAAVALGALRARDARRLTITMSCWLLFAVAVTLVWQQPEETVESPAWPPSASPATQGAWQRTSVAPGPLPRLP